MEVPENRIVRRSLKPNFVVEIDMNSERLKSTLVRSDATVREAIELLNADEFGIVLVVDEQQKLLGTITDGDIRRALLDGIVLEDPVDSAMHKNPLTSTTSASLDEMRLHMHQHEVLQMPVLDSRGRVVDLVLANEPEKNKRYENQVIIMVGGLGQRLRPLTENVPKPMLEVGGKPILQGIIENLVSQGLYNFTLCLNYLGDVVEDHFGDGNKFGATITYTRENRRMGTGGALSLLNERPCRPCIVMNGDILTTLDFHSLRQFHNEHKASATMSLNEFEVQIPFGVIETRGGKVKKMTEKPTHKSFVNAGIYMLSPEVFDYIREDTEFDMPTLMQDLIDQGVDVAGFPIFEHWLDIGRPTDLAVARKKQF